MLLLQQRITIQHKFISIIIYSIPKPSLFPWTIFICNTAFESIISNTKPHKNFTEIDNFQSVSTRNAMITADSQRDAVYFIASSLEKKPKRLLVRNYRLVYYDPRSVASIAWENVACSICSSCTAAREGEISDSFLTINLRVRGFTGFSRTIPIITSLVTTLWTETKSANESSNFFHILYVFDLQEKLFLLSYRKQYSFD